MTSVAVTMSIFVDASRIMPVDSERFLDSQCSNESCESQWEATEQNLCDTLTMSSKHFLESPGFVSKTRISSSAIC